jgi:hypothetical protein
MVKPAIDGGAVTVNAPHPGVTVGAGGAAGKTTAFMVASIQAGSVLIEDPQLLDLYLAFIVQHPGVLVNWLFTVGFKLLLYELKLPPGG